MMDRAMSRESIQQATLEHARDLAGGVTFLARKLGVGVHSLDAMLVGNEEIPGWVFLRAVDYINDPQMADAVPPGLPADWLEQQRGG
jgi:hypothetical protein